MSANIHMDTRDTNVIFIHSSLDDVGLTAAEFRVYSHLARRAGSDGAYPGIDSMCKTCLLSKPTVIKAVRELEDRGMIIAKRVPGKTTCYILSRASLWRMTSKKEVTVPDSTSKKEVTVGSNIGNGTSKKEVTKGYPIEGNPFKEIQRVDLEFPENLNTPEFKAAWENYRTYRRDQKFKSLKPRSITAQLQEMSGWGEPNAIKAINETIRNGWQGVFNKTTNTRGITAKKEESAKREFAMPECDKPKVERFT